MTWDLLWRNWYCLGRQQYPAIVFDVTRFHDYLVRYREAVSETAEPNQQTIAQAYLVAAALERIEEACTALLMLPAQDGLPLRTCLERVARKRCPDSFQQVVADFIGSWYYGTPKRSEPFIARWTPTGDFTRFCLVSIKRLAQAEQNRRKNLAQIPEGFEPGQGKDAATNESLVAATSGDSAKQVRGFVECFVSRLSDRCCRVVAIASQLQLNQKLLAEKLNVSEATVTRDVQQVVNAQEECIKSLHLESEPSQAWWWSDVRWISAEHPRIVAVVRELMGDVDQMESAADPDDLPENS